ncbi:hypothetical protein [Cyanobium sp. NS01]|nr:hypothetical protein [Cyanobium sp. NS01]
MLRVDHGHAVTCLAPLDFGGPDQGERVLAGDREDAILEHLIDAA